MKAIVQREFGAPDVLAVENVDLPEPAEGEVRVRVAAAGVHAVDTKIRQGEGPRSMPRPSLPMIPGREVAGIIDMVGPDVDSSLVGKRVVAHVGFRNGGYAEFALVPVTALHTVPDDVLLTQAVAAIGTGRTAQLVLEAAPIRPDDVVIISGASGGLGSQLTQLTLASGATVVALYGGETKRAAVEGLASGEERFFPVDSTNHSWPTTLAQLLGDREASLLLDGVGGATGRAAVEALGRGARVAIVGWSSGEAVRIDTNDLITRALSVTVPIGRPGVQLRDLETRALIAVAEGRVRPLLDEYPLERAADAHAVIEQRLQRGKVVLVP